MEFAFFSGLNVMFEVIAEGAAEADA